MAWEDKTLKKNAQNEIVPQAFNDVIDDYEPVKSTDGALHNVLYGPNGLPLKAINDKLEVRSTELEALVQGLASEGKLEQTRALVDTLSTKVDELNTKVDALTEDGSLKVQQSGTIVELLYSHAGSADVIISPGSVITLLPADERLGFKEYRAIFYFERSVDHEVMVEHMVTPLTRGPAESFQFDTNKSKVRVDTYSDIIRIRVRNNSTTDVKCNYARILGVK